MEGAENESVVLRCGDTIETQPQSWHGFRVKGDETARLLGAHASPRRIVNHMTGWRWMRAGIE